MPRVPFPSLYRHTDLGSHWRFCSGPCTDSNPSQPWSRSLRKTLFQTITHRRKSLCGSTGVSAEKFQHTTEEKKYNSIALEWAGETVWIYLHHPSKAAQLRTKRELITPWFLPWREMTECEWAADFSSCAGHCQRILFLLPHTEYWTMSWITGDRKKLRKWQKGSRRVLKGCGSYQLCHGFHQDSAHRPLGMLHLQSPLNGPLHILPTHPHHGWLPVPIPSSGGQRDSTDG